MSPPRLRRGCIPDRLAKLLYITGDRISMFDRFANGLRSNLAVPLAESFQNECLESRRLYRPRCKRHGRRIFLIPQMACLMSDVLPMRRSPCMTTFCPDSANALSYRSSSGLGQKNSPSTTHPHLKGFIGCSFLRNFSCS